MKTGDDLVNTVCDMVNFHMEKEEARRKALENKLKDKRFYDLLKTGAIVLLEKGSYGVVLNNAIAFYSPESSNGNYIFSIKYLNCDEPIWPLFGPNAYSTGYHIISIWHIPSDEVLRNIDIIFRGDKPNIGDLGLVYDEQRDYYLEVTKKDIEERFGCKVHIVEED